MPLPKIIHQTYLDFGTPISTYPIFLKSKELWTTWCEENGYEYRFWTREMIEKRIQLDKPIYDFYINLRFNWNRIDFARYLIVNYYGGIYIDMDIVPKEGKDIDTFFQSHDRITGQWHNNKVGTRDFGKFLISNSVIGAPVCGLVSLINYAIEQVEEKDKIAVYKQWKIRYMLQSTGAQMFARWCKKKKYKNTPHLDDYIKDYGVNSWLKDFN